MEELFNLPTLLRVFLFTAFTLVLAVLLLLIVYKFIAKKKDKLLITYFITLFLMILFVSISRTPLDDKITKFSFYMLNSFLLIPTTMAIILFIKRKTKWYLVDGILLFLNMPFWTFVPIYKYFYIISVYYLVVRVLLKAYDTYKQAKNEPGVYMIKEALDKIEHGILLANDSGQIIFINKAMKAYFEMLEISEHLRIKDIAEELFNSKYLNRSLTSTSIILKIKDKALNFQFKKNNRNFYTQIVCLDITEKEKVVTELEKSQNDLKATKKELEHTLLAIEKNEKNNEILKMKGNIHDTLSQRLSILHCYMLANKVDNINQIKQLIISMLPDMYSKIDVSNQEKLQQLINSFALINVSLKINGELPLDEEKASFALKIIRECSTNAVKHGNANEVIVNIENKDGQYNISITNNGSAANSVVASNGLKSIQYQLSKLNGSMNIISKPRFQIEFII